MTSPNGWRSASGAVVREIVKIRTIADSPSRRSTKAINGLPMASRCYNRKSRLKNVKLTPSSDANATSITPIGNSISPAVNLNRNPKRNPNPMNNSNSMSAEEYQAFIKNGLSEGGKVVTRLKQPKNKLQRNVLSVGEFRDEHVDQDEHDLQSLGVKWFRLAFPGILLYAIPNAAKRSFMLAARMKAEGMERGVPDLCLAYPHNGKPGLYIETKTVNGSPSPAQIKVQAYLRAVGYEVIMPTTFEEFQAGVLDYMR